MNLDTLTPSTSFQLCIFRTLTAFNAVLLVLAIFNAAVRPSWVLYPSCPIQGFNTICPTHNTCVVIPRVEIPWCDETVVMTAENNKTYSGLDDYRRVFILNWIRFASINNSDCYVRSDCSESTYYIPYGSDIYVLMFDIILITILAASLLVSLAIWIRYILDVSVDETKELENFDLATRSFN